MEIASNEQLTINNLTTAKFLPDEYTVATLPTPSQQWLGYYAKVTDLYGDKRDLVLCTRSGTKYNWEPVRPIYAKSMEIAGDVTLYPLKSPSVVFMTGTLAAARKVNLSNEMAWNGCQFEVAFDGVLGLGSLGVLGAGITTAIPFLTGSRKRFVFDGSVWKVY